MRAVYRNPKELATCLKDQVDLYLDDLLTYEKLSDRIIKLVEANEERIFKDGIISLKILAVIGESRHEIIKKILEEKK